MALGYVRFDLIRELVNERNMLKDVVKNGNKKLRDTRILFISAKTIDDCDFVQRELGSHLPVIFPSSLASEMQQKADRLGVHLIKAFTVSPSRPERYQTPPPMRRIIPSPTRPVTVYEHWQISKIK